MKRDELGTAPKTPFGIVTIFQRRGVISSVVAAQKSSDRMTPHSSRDRGVGMVVCTEGRGDSR